MRYRAKLGSMWVLKCDMHISPPENPKKRANRSGQPRHVPYSTHSKPHSPVHQAISVFWGLPHQPPLLLKRGPASKTMLTRALVVFLQRNAYALGREQKLSVEPRLSLA